MSRLVIRVENLSKEYRLGTLGHGTLSQDLQSAWAKFRGREDPNAIIGSPSQALLNSANGRFCALNNISFDVYEGEILGIIGRNGAGKSTLLKIISRVTSPTCGSVKIRGRVASLLEVGTGFHPELTGRENVFLNGAILGMRKEEIEQKFDEIVRFAEIGKFIDTPVKRYSSGMYVRLAFAVAAHLEPEILLVDEVLAVGDLAFQKKCIGKMNEVAKAGRTVLFVSHNMGAVSMLCSKLVFLDKGTIIKMGETNEVITAYCDYIQENHDIRQAEQIFQPNPTLQAQITRIRIMNSESALTLIHDIHNPIHFEIDFTVRHPFSNLVLACSVFTPLEQVVFTTNEMDWIHYTGSEKNPEFPKEPGLYTAIFNIPAPLLHLGSYELRFTLAEPNITNLENLGGFFIEITDSGSFMSYPFKREGLIAVPIPWKIEKTGSLGK